MAAWAACSPVSGGTMSRSVRWPRRLVAVSRPAGMVANQPSRTTRRPAGPSIRSRRGLLESQSAVPSMILVTGLKDSCRSSRARIRQGSSAAGSADRGHQPPSSSVQAGRSGWRRSRSAAGGAGLIAVRDSMALDMISALSVYDGHVLPAATAVLSGDSRKVMAPRPTGASPCGRGLVSAAVLGRRAWLQRGVSLADTHLDALGLYLGGLGHHDLQYAVLGRRLDLVRLHVAGQGDRAAEGAVEPLGAVHLLLGGVVREVPLALDGQQAVLEGDLHIAGLDAGKLGRHQVGVLAFGYVDRRRPDRGAGIAVVLLLARPPAASLHRPQHLILGRAEVLEQVPARHGRSHVVLPCIWPGRRPANPEEHRSGERYSVPSYIVHFTVNSVHSQTGCRRQQRLGVLGYRSRPDSAAIAAAAVQAGGDRPVHAGRPAEALEDANDGGGDIDLPGIGAMPGTGRIGMVHVVPALTEGEQRERPQVGGAVVAPGSERAGADDVAQRIDAPGDVLQQGDADQSGA